jgi:L,D-peptidoglycan transpeptidase YkuD (ErfK/YbiS/YcfS/YnhG family)
VVAEESCRGFNIRRGVFVVAFLLVGELVPSNAYSAAARAGQVITVEATSATSTTAVVREWRWTGRRYAEVFVPTIANVGIHGVGPTREGLGRTPVGIFTLTHAFGNEANNGTRLPYFRAGPDDWWDENPASPAYNRHVRSVDSPGGDSENLYYAGAAYAHAVVINYNMDPVVKGAGSGFFLHVSTGRPTAGCVAINPSLLTEIMRWLRPSEDPVISIGVAAAAMKIVRSP